MFWAVLFYYKLLSSESHLLKGNKALSTVKRYSTFAGLPHHFYQNNHRGTSQGITLHCVIAT